MAMGQGRSVSAMDGGGDSAHEQLPADGPDTPRESSLRWLPSVVRLIVRLPVVAALAALVAFGVLRLPGDDAPIAESLIGGLERPRIGRDVVEVWACRVPVDSASELYADVPLRVELDVDRLAGQFNAGVAPYFASISHRQYSQEFIGGGEVMLDADDDYVSCVERAFEQSSPSATVVLAIADAQHVERAPGGFANRGRGCADASATDCPARESRRYAYVGAADFADVWGDRPPLDLVEHELGHTLGWQHSGVDFHSGGYLSALDVMSDSASPRMADPDSRHAPDTIGVQRLIAGWLRDVEVSVVEGGASFTLSPSTEWLDDLESAVIGTRLLVLPVDELTFLTVEVLVPSGYNAHLPAAGIAVHRVTRDLEDRSLVTAIQPITPSGMPPYTDLLQSNDSISVDGWRIDATQWDEGRWLVAVEPVGSDG